MLEPSEFQRAEERHEDVFLARYGSLRAWALRLTGGDDARAEDLVHDVFVQFTLTRPGLARVQNIDGYLYTMLRNLHVSQMRRERRRQSPRLAVVEYDSVEVALRAADPRACVRVQDDLRQVCRYACLRKETSKAGSVLILRFMHGYYPSEIARVMCSSREAVEERLRVARDEARQFLKDPASLRFIAGKKSPGPSPATNASAQSPEELLRDLRRAVFDSRCGVCLTEERLARLYRDGGRGPDCATLAHAVSCPRCMDEVNRIQGLPPLSERYPTDSLGAEPRRKGRDGDDGSDGPGPADGDGGATGGASEEEARRCRRRAREVFEHRPRELCVSVNGRPLAAQKVAAALNEQKLNVGHGEEINFVEVFSEQDVRLMYLDPASWPADDEGVYALRVELSDRRTLEARLTYADSAPTVQVIYRDPLMTARPAAELDPFEERATQAASDGVERHEASNRLGGLARAAWRRLLKLLGRFANPFSVLKPGALAAALSVLVIAALLFTRLYAPPVSAAALLRRAAAAEEWFASASPGLVLHRTVFVEELKADGRSVASRRRVEVWQGASGIRLRRLYDEQGRLVAGEWAKSDGTATVFRRGATPAETGAATVGSLLEAGEAWRIEPSAKSFSALGAAGSGLKVEEGLGTYVVGYEAAPASEGVLRAALWLNKADLHAFRMTLDVRRGGAAIEYRFIEGGFEKRRAEDVPPGVYQLEPELLDAPAGPGAGNESRMQGDARSHPSASAAQPPAVASAELEVEVAYLLNQIKANLGEQVSVGRTTGGALRVEALVESEERKEAILRALGPVLNNPAVVVEVDTVAEALERRREAEAAPPKVTEREVSVRAGRFPADAELRAHFAARLADTGRVDDEIKQFAARAMSHSRQALLQASALKRLADRFTPAESRSLGADARAKWLSMIREHAEAYRREVEALNTQLGTVFHAGGQEAPAEAMGDENVAQAAERLLRLSYEQDGAVRSAFTVSEEGGAASAIKSPQFWQGLAASERLASAIQQAYER